MKKSFGDICMRKTLRDKKENAITLIALIITIIILLVLVGVVIAAVSNDSGILSRASLAKKQYDIVAARESLEMSIQDIKIKVHVEENRDIVIKDCDLLKDVEGVTEIEYLSGELSSATIKDVIDPKFVIVTYTKYKFKLNEKLDIIGEEMVPGSGSGFLIENNDSLIGKISKINESGVTEVVVNDESYNVNVLVIKGDLILDGRQVEGASFKDNVYEFGNAQVDVATESQEAQNMVVLKVNGDITISSGITVTTCKSAEGYGGPKGFLIYSTGKIIDDGIISMTARGAKAQGQNVYLFKNSNGEYEVVPAEGGNGAQGTFSSRVATGNDYKYYGNSGQSGVDRATGGGGSGGGYTWNADLSSIGSGNGSAGTSYSGGSGGGSSSGYGSSGCSKGANAELNGGKGGNSGSKRFDSYRITGGAGNGTGNNYLGAKDTNITGTGGLLIMYSSVLSGTGRIESNGSAATTNWCASGGGSGAGSINIFANNISKTLEIAARGKTTDGCAGYGGKGGNGSVTKAKIVQGNCLIEELFDKGNGTAENPYLLSTKEMLKEFRYEIEDGNSYDGKVIAIDADIQLNENEIWVPIGTKETKFNGIFDGNGKSIKGVTLDGSKVEQSFFGVVGKDAKISNLVIEGTATQKAARIAGVCNINYGTIENCVNKVNITKSGDYYGTGGICCTNYGLIKNCANYGNISSFDSVGGITGYNNGVVRNCYNKGKIYGSGWTTGGIIGHNGSESGKTGYVYNCYNNASITAGKSGYVAGISGGVGLNGSKSYIYSCYTIKNTAIYGNAYSTPVLNNNYTTSANVKLQELNNGIDTVNGVDDEQPWVSDENNINDGYPILSWQVN